MIYEVFGEHKLEHTHFKQVVSFQPLREKPMWLHDTFTLEELSVPKLRNLDVAIQMKLESWAGLQV